MCAEIQGNEKEGNEAYELFIQTFGIIIAVECDFYTVQLTDRNLKNII